ncbi:uncharacterized protein LOC131249464 [Magnolia sinica]|uniref:uncharacterized protein LOC131249464 n=1 Tax=Magnolia sinica TaxID=86752 RepID=UPI00265B6429|nr:uncharacterized protein LOC131249464 [Magnolia sinica]
MSVIETQELSDEGNENDDEGEGGSAESDEKGVQGEGSGGNIVKPSLLMDEFRVGIDELKKEREELKKERDELRKEREELRKREERLDEREALLKEKELLKMERVDLNERVQLKKEKELFFIMNEELNRRMCELLRETENLAKEREALKKEKEYFYIQRGQFMRDEDEELKKKVKVEDMEEKEQGNVELEVQSYGMAERNLLDEAPVSPPVYVRRTKRVLKPSYYMVSPFLSLSSINTTPNVVRRPEEAVNFPTSPIPFHLQMDPFRMLSTDELKEVEKYYEANKETGEASWFKSIWVDDAWVDSVVSIRMRVSIYIDFHIVISFNRLLLNHIILWSRLSTNMLTS